jgi:hypothetical protein
MLIVPASKVSVPLTVVMRTRSSVPARAIELPAKPNNAVVELAIIDVEAQVLPVNKTQLKMPFRANPALPMLSVLIPVLDVVDPTAEASIFPDAPK